MLFLRKAVHQLKQPYILLLVGAFLFLFIYLALVTGVNVKNSPVATYFSHTWRSIKKFPNIFYVTSFFKSSNLPEYRLVIDPDDLRILDDSLPINHDSLTYGFLSDENKNYVRGYFMSPDNNYQTEIKLRYRGLIQNNWQAEKKSLRLKFPKNNLFSGMESLNLIIPEDRGYFLEPLSIYRAKNLGLFTPEFNFVRVYINNRDFGVYLAAEAWSAELLARNNILPSNNIFSNKDNPDQVKDENPAFSNWKSYIAVNEDGPFEELNALSELTNKATDAEFIRKVRLLVDLDKIYKWQILNVLAGSAHQSYFSNFTLLFRKETGKFEPAPWNVEYEPLKEHIYDSNLPLLVRRIFKHKPYSDDFLKLLKQHLDDESLNKDLAYYDSLSESVKGDLYRDQAKNQNNIELDHAIDSGRELVINNYLKARELINRPDSFNVTIWEKLNYSHNLKFEGNFRYLRFR